MIFRKSLAQTLKSKQRNQRFLLSRFDQIEFLHWHKVNNGNGEIFMSLEALKRSFWRCLIGRWSAILETILFSLFFFLAIVKAVVPFFLSYVFVRRSKFTGRQVCYISVTVCYRASSRFTASRALRVNNSCSERTIPTWWWSPPPPFFLPISTLMSNARFLFLLRLLQPSYRFKRALLKQLV